MFFVSRFGSFSFKRKAGSVVAALALATSFVSVAGPSARVEAKLRPASSAVDTLARGTQQISNFTGLDAGSNPVEMTTVGSKSVFWADDGVYGNEPWVTDGTTAGTMLLKDIAPGSNPSDPRYMSQMIEMNGSVYFAATSGALDYALWSTDGTTAGTKIVHQFTVDYDDCPPNNFVVLNSKLYFAADDVETGCELWTSDGTDAGTTLVADVVPGGGGAYPTQMIAMGSKIVYAGFDETYDREPWISDGTAAGTHRIANIAPGEYLSSNPENFVVYASGAKVAFVAWVGIEQALYVTDGNTVTQDSPVGMAPGWLAATSDMLYYTASGSNCPLLASDECHTLFRVSGSGESTLLWEIPEGDSFTELTTVGNVLFLVREFDGIQRVYRWADGGPLGILMDVRPSLFDYPFQLNSVNGKLIFAAYSDATGGELYISDGTDAGTSLVKDFEPGEVGSGLNSIASFGNRILLSVDTTATGPELWVSDGTPSGTTLLKNINIGSAGSFAGERIVFGDQVLFSAEDGSVGNELWISDGTPGSARLVKDIFAGKNSSDPSNFALLGSNVVFSAIGENYDEELWITDGTATGTRVLSNVNPENSSSISKVTPAGGKVYFVTDSYELGSALWVTDGSTAGTRRVADGGQSLSEIFEIVAVGSKLFFAGNDGTNGIELWVTDGVEPPTMIEITGGPGSSTPENLVAVGNKLFFRANNGVGGPELWSSDGTPEGTDMVKDINADGFDGGSYPDGLAALGTRLIFSAQDEFGNSEPWISDGTTDGTFKLKEISEYGASMQLQRGRYVRSNATVFAVTSSGSRAYFAASDDENSTELWVTDGTSNGTHLVKDISPGSYGSDPSWLTIIGENVFFGATDFSDQFAFNTQIGYELWTSDGSESGTHVVSDISQGLNDSYPGELLAFGNRVVFSANKYGSGRQLFITDGSPSTFVSLDQPVRIMNTRSGEKVGAFDGSGAAYTLQVTGVAGVPSTGVAAVALNVTAVATEADNVGGYVTVYPCGTLPDASNLNFVANQIIPNAVVAPVSASGKVCFYVYGKAHLLADVSGWFPAGGFTALAKPERLLNTRPAGDAGKVGALDGSGAAYTLQIAGQGGLPTAGIGSVALNVTVVDGSTNDYGGYVTVYPCGTRPEASNLNFTTGQIVPNAVIAPVSADGKVCLYVYGKAHLLVDASGYLAS